MTGRVARIAVAAPNQPAVDAALDIGAAGGNAVDAAVAALLVASVTEPGVISPMGGAFVAVWPASGDPIVVDGNVAMPGLGGDPDRLGGGLREVSMAYGGGVTTFGGYGSVAVPGLFAAVDEAHRRYGVAPWRELFNAAITTARNGFQLGQAAAYYLSFAEDLFMWDSGTAAFLRQGQDRSPQFGDWMRDDNLAAALEHVAMRGAQTAYTGDLAATLVAAMDAHDGLITAQDLAAYRAQVSEPLMSRIRDWQIATTPPPAIGGPSLTAMLHLLHERETATPADLLEIQRIVLSYRHRHLDYASDLGAAGQELIRLVDSGGLAALSSSPDTVHVSTLDAAGNACAITASAGYGAGATIPGTGMLLNNCLGEPELNRLGLHALPAGSRLASNMAPRVAVRDDGARLAIGSPGADRITTALMQVLRAVCIDGTDLQKAIDAPRLHVRIDAETGSLALDVEGAPELAEIARATGWPVRVHERRAMFFGGVAAAMRGRRGRLVAASDPRREGATGLR